MTPLKEEHSRPESLTKEDSSWKLYRECRKIRDTKTVYYLLIISLFVFSFINLSSFMSVEETISRLKGVSENLLTTSITILGFSLAAYSIFATLSDKDLLIFMHNTKHPDYVHSYLKVAHFTFIKNIYDILLLAALAFFCSQSIPILSALNNSSHLDDDKLLLFISIILTVIQSVFIVLFDITKSFVYNVFQSVLTATRWHKQDKP
ncbi:hypothetical protein [Agarivorans sp. Toyoura001]|uniref:hypothetical protein n=1 Tax=Agarivorans sp. Toyoura001 TaxID=2283141 RepID=UPI0010F6ABFA|nr:hypothetical protein [Agarivorans sp. Toyoura001]